MTINESINQIREREAAMPGQCECDYDYQDERYVRCNPKTLCTVHDTCELCGERPATATVFWQDGWDITARMFKACDRCEKETAQ
jgi:hypothetical protein